MSPRLQTLPRAPRYDAAAATLSLGGYTDAWVLGSGLPTSLPPGEYAVTGRDLMATGIMLTVENRYHVRLPHPAPASAATYAPGVYA